MGRILAAFLKLIKEGELVCGLGGSCKLKEISLRAGDKGPPHNEEWGGSRQALTSVMTHLRFFKLACKALWQF